MLSLDNGSVLLKYIPGDVWVHGHTQHWIVEHLFNIKVGTYTICTAPNNVDKVKHY